eukprot:gene4962-3560_t
MCPLKGLAILRSQPVSRGMLWPNTAKSVGYASLLLVGSFLLRLFLHQPSTKKWVEVIKEKGGGEHKTTTTTQKEKRRERGSGIAILSVCVGGNVVIWWLVKQCVCGRIRGAIRQDSAAMWEIETELMIYTVIRCCVLPRKRYIVINKIVSGIEDFSAGRASSLAATTPNEPRHTGPPLIHQDISIRRRRNAPLKRRRGLRRVLKKQTPSAGHHHPANKWMRVGVDTSDESEPRKVLARTSIESDAG